MELKLPPVIVFFCFALIMYVLDTLLPFGFFDFFGRLVLVKILIGLAVIVSLVSLGQFYFNKTTVDPTKPEKASSLVTNGVFSVSRNPMYFAMLLLLLALGLVLCNAFNTLVAAVFVGYMNRFQVIPEERMLQEKFGKIYKDYMCRTRRWF